MINLEQKYENFYKLLLLFFSALFFVLLISAVFIENLNDEWESYQQSYRELLVRLDLPQLRDEINALDGNFREIYMPDLHKTDRCISCHLAIENPYVKNVDNPLKSHHPVINQHEISRFGCTLCHGGQGNALSVREAHATDKEIHWDKPLLDLEIIESSCGHCHLAVFMENTRLKTAQKLVAGKRIFKREGCMGCHKVRSVGGSVGPDLTNLANKPPKAYNYQNISGKHTRQNWLYEHFLQPQKISVNSQMLSFELSIQELQSLGIFALALSDLHQPADFYDLEFIEEFKGKRKMISGNEGYGLFCAACHGKKGNGRDYEIKPFGAVSLGNEDFLAIASEDLIAFTLLEGRSNRLMDSWFQRFSGLQNAELSAIINFIKAAEIKAPEFNTAKQKLHIGNYSIGKRLYEKYCLTCHQRNIRNPIAPWPLAEEFRQNASLRLLYQILVDGRKNTAMPGWSKMGEKNLTHLISFINPVGPENTGRENLTDSNIKNGQALFHYLCKRCHGNYGEGNAGPAILNRNFLNTVSKKFLRNIISQGKKHTPMFGWMKKDLGEGQLTANEINDIIGFMKSMADSIPEYIYPGRNAGDVEKGKKLFSTFCSECHGINGEGTKAPQLNNTEFLNAASNGFIFATVTLGRTGTKMPSWGYPGIENRPLSIEEREHITSYIRSWQNLYIKNPRSTILK